MFEGMSQRGIVSWKSMIMSYVQRKKCNEVSNSFVKRVFDVVKLNVGTFEILLSEWVHLATLQHGTGFHLLTKKYI